MKKAYDPVGRASLTVKQYGDLYGPRFDEGGQPRGRRQVICSVCGGAAHTIAEDNLNRSATWGHDPNPKLYCPVKDSGRKPYDELPPGKEDEATGKLIRASFLAHWRRHWCLVRELAPYADIKSLISFIEMMDARRIWDRVGLVEWQIPYMFLVSFEFPPPKQKDGKSYREVWYRFTLEPRIRTFADLWIDAQPATYISRNSYRIPRSGEPGPSHYIETDVFQIDPAFLQKPKGTLKTIHRFATELMQKRFGV